MDRREAEALYDQGKEPTVVKLLEFDEENQKLKEKIASSNLDSTNSSKPPSSDRPGIKRYEKNTEQKGERNPGGQPGHKGSHRELIPTEKVNKVVPVLPKTCGRCKRPLPQDIEKVKIVGEPFRYQTTEIPPISPIITEYQCHKTQCDCGCLNRAELPEEVRASQFEPRLTGLIAYMTGVHRIPRRGIEVLLETLLNTPISLGSVQNLLEETSSALEPIDQKLKEALDREPVLNIDETGWKHKDWLWIFVAQTFVYFQIAASRSSDVLKSVLGEFYDGIICADRFGAYTKYHKGLMQICLAHLKRDILGITEISQSPCAIAFTNCLLEAKKELFHRWYAFRGGGMTRSRLIEETLPVRQRIRQCLEEYQDVRDRSVRKLARNLLKRYDHLFTFIFKEGVSPTNNIAERGIRPAVQWRKICFGNRSDNGRLLTARLLTVTRTCLLQGRNSFEFLVEAISSYRCGNPAPSLI